MLLCGECGDFSLLFMEDNLKRKGCASIIYLLCEQCGWKHSFSISKKLGKSFEVNRRITCGMTTLGNGSVGEREFCSILNMPPPLTEKAFLSNLQTAVTLN